MELDSTVGRPQKPCTGLTRLGSPQNFIFSRIYVKMWLPRWLRVKNPPVMQEMWVRSLGGEDPLEKGMAPTPVFLPGKAHGQRSLVGYSP